MRRCASLAPLFVLLVCILALPQQKTAFQAELSGQELRKGEVIPSVRSATEPEQSYALYIPSNYSPERRWPIVYVFDPGANGSRPLKLMKNAAEQYGYILVGSNNSRNGPWAPARESANEMWADTHAKLSIDDRRVYFAGFSGAARLASQLAQSCNCAQGIFLSGAGFSPGKNPSDKLKFAVYSTAGLGDFNYDELLQLDEKLEKLGIPHFLKRFDGEHEWAPAAVWDDALAFSALLEMKNNLRPRDNSVIAGELAKAIELVRKREADGALAFALADARSLAAEFDGLADTAALKERVAALLKNPIVRSQQKQEKAGIEKQRALTDEIATSINGLGSTDGERNVLLSDIALRVRRIRKDMLKENRPENKLILQRVLGGLFIMCMETGGPMMEQRNYLKARMYFEIAAEARPDSAWPFLSLAQCDGAAGDTKSALLDLKNALQAGYSIHQLTTFVKNNPKLTPLENTAEYKKLIAGDPGREQ